MRKLVLAMATAAAAALLTAALAGAAGDNFKIDRIGWIEADGGDVLIMGTYTCDPADRPSMRVGVSLVQEHRHDPRDGIDFMTLPCTGKTRPWGTVVALFAPQRMPDWEPGRAVVHAELRELDGTYIEVYPREITLE